MEQDKVRAEFESALIKAAEEAACLPPNLARDRDGQYVSTRIASAWWGWQASREAVVVVLPEWFDRFDSGDRTYWVEDVEKAIKAAGIRTK